MKKLFQKLRGKKFAVAAAVMALTGALCAVGVHAEGESSGTAAIQSAVSTALASTQSDAMTMIGSILPYALAIVGAVLVVTIGIKVFKKISGKAG